MEHKMPEQLNYAKLFVRDLDTPAFIIDSDGNDNVRRHIGVAAFPITGNRGNILGAMAVYWEI